MVERDAAGLAMASGSWKQSGECVDASSTIPGCRLLLLLGPFALLLFVLDAVVSSVVVVGFVLVVVVEGPQGAAASGGANRKAPTGGAA